MGNLQKIVYLSEAEYQSLIDNNSITKNGVTINYSADDIYMTPATSGEEIVFDGEYNSVTNKAATVSTVTNALSNMTVTDVQVDGSSIVSNGIANIPLADDTHIGVVKINSTYGLGMTADGYLRANGASSSQIKIGTDVYRPIVSANQHVSVFYSLAKAAGDSTQSASSNSVGVYTANAKGSIQDMLGIADLISTNENSLVASKAYSIGDLFVAQGNIYKATSAISLGSTIIPNGNCASTNLETELSAKVDKDAIDNAGITARSYTTKFGGEFTVTTATTTGYSYPYARASVTGRIDKLYKHRVTVNGTEYILPTRLWYEITESTYKVYEYLGNLSLYISNTSGVPGGTDNVSFIIISDLNDSNSIDVLTTTAGTYTIKVEQIQNTQKVLPNSLIYGEEYAPIVMRDSGGSTYAGISIGVNNLVNKRGVFAVGYGNEISNEFSQAFGIGNDISESGGQALGYHNVVSGYRGQAFGYHNVVSGSNAKAFGMDTEATDFNSFTFGDGTLSNAKNMIAMGNNNVAANTTFSNFAANTVYKKGDIVNGKYTAQLPVMAWLCKKAHTSGSGTTIQSDMGDSNWTLAPSNGDTLFVIGNGSSIHRSNAVKIDVVGNEYIGGDLYVNCDDNSANGTKVATINDIPSVPVTDVKINDTSILSSGIANIPYATTSIYGVTKLSDSTNTTSSSLAATSTAVKAAYDLASNKVAKTGDVMTGTLNLRNTNLYFSKDSDTLRTGFIHCNDSGAFSFWSYPTDNSDASNNTKREVYSLPTPSTGLTEQKSYTILTTKNVITATQGGTGQSSYTIGDILYCGTANTLSKLSGNTTTTRKFLRSVAATSGTAAAPAWDTLSKSDVGLSNVENTALSTWSGSSNITTLGTISTGTWQGSTIGVAYGGTGNTTGTATLCTTTVDTTNDLYTLGVTSSSGTTIKRNTKLLSNGYSIKFLTGLDYTVSTAITPNFLTVFSDSSINENNVKMRLYQNKTAVSDNNYSLTTWLMTGNAVSGYYNQLGIEVTNTGQPKINISNNAPASLTSALQINLRSSGQTIIYNYGYPTTSATGRSARNFIAMNRTGIISFYEFPTDNTTGVSTNREYYSLPAPTAGRTAEAGFNILTTKIGGVGTEANPVTIPSNAVLTVINGLITGYVMPK